MQSETGFPSSHQLKSYVASKSRRKLAARAVLSADAVLLVFLYLKFCLIFWIEITWWQWSASKLESVIGHRHPYIRVSKNASIHMGRKDFSYIQALCTGSAYWPLYF